MIETDHLHKRYGERVAVVDVTMRCEPGTVTGLIGPNGTGKSTTLRMICGLTRPTAGHARVNGVPYARLTNPGRAVGVLLDAAAVHPGRTGHETLAVAAAVIGVNRARVDEVLALVELDGRPRVGACSLGMRQRLGLAQALLGEPSLLILDEPTVGLDQTGLRWLFDLVRKHADAGGTVLLATHQIDDVRRIADRLVELP